MWKLQYMPSLITPKNLFLQIKLLTKIIHVVSIHYFCYCIMIRFPQAKIEVESFLSSDPYWAKIRTNSTQSCCFFLFFFFQWWTKWQTQLVDKLCRKARAGLRQMVRVNGWLLRMGTAFRKAQSAQRLARRLRKTWGFLQFHNRHKNVTLAGERVTLAGTHRHAATEQYSLVQSGDFWTCTRQFTFFGTWS